MTPVQGTIDNLFSKTDIPDNTLEVSYGFMFPDVCPKHMYCMRSGIIRDGVFYPDGSVSRHFFHLQKSATAAAYQSNRDVYFIRSSMGPVKIGIANDVGKRLEALQCASPYELSVVGVIHGGDEKTEARLHRRFSKWHMRGEWFAWNEELAALLETLGEQA